MTLPSALIARFTSVARQCSGGSYRYGRYVDQSTTGGRCPSLVAAQICASVRGR